MEWMDARSAARGEDPTASTRGGRTLGRRGFLGFGAALGLGGLGGLGLSGCTPAPLFSSPNATDAFSLGVMSGLHSADAVVLWTRLNPATETAAEVSWTVAADAACRDVVATGRAAVSAASDYTVKVLVEGLAAGREYWFRFRTPGGAVSPVGHARTLPPAGAAVAELRLAFASCQNWAMGWYNAWDGIAAERLDAVVWLGDYIYESASSLPNSVRLDPIGLSSTLAEYRAKYRLYRSDPSLQRAHAAHPFVPIWDDHEFRDNYSRADIAAEPTRYSAAQQAWFEYMPVWPIDGRRIYRSLRFGNLGELDMLDTRQYRDEQVGGNRGGALQTPESTAYAAAAGRTIMGATQRQWLFDRLSGAQADAVTWKLIGNQVMISPTRVLDLDTPELRRVDPTLVRHAGAYFNGDAWIGYMAERDALLGYLAEHNIQNVAFLTGDIHSFWQSTLQADFDAAASPLVANEFVSGSISSHGPDIVGQDPAWQLEQLALQMQPSFNYVDFRRHGYGLLEATPGALRISYRTTFTDVLGAPTTTTAQFELLPGNPVPRTLVRG
jgi:alkaline phosphatase D